ncbi:MAG: hypothetical protein ABSH05_19565 [Bryobacteraceae bacterium]
MYNSGDQENDDMPTPAADPTTEPIPTPSDADAMAALDYTSRYYLGMSAEKFLSLLDSGEISASDQDRIPGLSRVLDMLAMVRC